MSDNWPTVDLYFTEQGEGFPLIIIHGLFGSADNWRTLAKKFAENYKVYCVDLRNHGRSPHVESMNYHAMAADLEQFMVAQQIEQAHIIGHSMGGKVAMQLALNHPERIAKLIVADIAPVTYEHGHDDVIAAFYAVRAAGGVASRKEGDVLMSEYVKELGVRQFLMTNLEKKETGKLEWRVGLDQIRDDYESVVQAPAGTPFNGKALFIRGGHSHYVLDSYWPQIEALFPQAQLSTIDGAGHWLHAEKPLDFFDTVSQFLAD
ncbi:alpha/beta fold hydrolase [Oceanospirillum beijerinckii]|uniref:alpha/beta fold hydrolase n=1 Tax=Oceanospirillum beijerinckii TaxID=64976 RepID=UPI00040EA083|nr:alpha/beta fold hydrolase [Oceanospirillum beijerinckii]MAC47520.1 alpha/beta hydrolase [Oceanospirillum sp.]